MRYLGEEKPSLEDLVHFGVKGMRWGVRNSQAPTSRTKKIAIGVGTGVVVAGTVAATLLLRQHGSQPFSNVEKVASSSSDIGSRLFDSSGKINESFLSNGKIANIKLLNLVGEKYGYGPRTMPSQMSESARNEYSFLSGKMHSAYWSNR